jgi:hypothetical protein
MYALRSNVKSPIPVKIAPRIINAVACLTSDDELLLINKDSPIKINNMVILFRTLQTQLKNGNQMRTHKLEYSNRLMREEQYQRLENIKLRQGITSEICKNSTNSTNL